METVLWPAPQKNRGVETDVTGKLRTSAPVTFKDIVNAQSFVSGRLSSSGIFSFSAFGLKCLPWLLWLSYLAHLGSCPDGASVHAHSAEQ